ncbi:hypothetical protein C8Q75DRAFT_876903 [Abortiporus biennis]|nr:hypothetical protein C8Q75DRAFT_876903 [Abortiporus biennis]
MAIPQNRAPNSDDPPVDRDPDHDRYNSDVEDSLSDASSDLVEIDAAEFPRYFLEHNDRLFHSHGINEAPYPLPVDGEEQERTNNQHELLYDWLGSHYIGPVSEVLGRRSGSYLRALDLGTGTGRWYVVNDMAREFQHVNFDGVDIVPICPRITPANVRFEIWNFNDSFRHHEPTYDLVHARSISMGVINYSDLIIQIAQVLRPGGLFLACEWGRGPAMAFEDHSEVYAKEQLPRSAHFFEIVNNALYRHFGVRGVARELKIILAQSGLFRNIEETRHLIPIGTWPSTPREKDIGRRLQRILTLYAHSMSVMLSNTGYYSPFDVECIVQGFIHEVNHPPPGMACAYYTVHARKA